MRGIINETLFLYKKGGHEQRERRFALFVAYDEKIACTRTARTFASTALISVYNADQP
ncbi:MAG: hypothetical protein LBK73_03270 [Treponema sp.]|jgi:hypothetical protein|nr:hypothetical protein [Treponema sp.]